MPTRFSPGGKIPTGFYPGRIFSPGVKPSFPPGGKTTAGLVGNFGEMTHTHTFPAFSVEIQPWRPETTKAGTPNYLQGIQWFLGGPLYYKTLKMHKIVAIDNKLYSLSLIIDA